MSHMRLKAIYGISAGKYRFNSIMPAEKQTNEFKHFFRWFFRWQRLENPKDDSDPNHHDVAILITRKDICSLDGCT